MRISIVYKTVQKSWQEKMSRTFQKGKMFAGLKKTGEYRVSCQKLNNTYYSTLKIFYTSTKNSLH